MSFLFKSIICNFTTRITADCVTVTCLLEISYTEDKIIHNVRLEILQLIVEQCDVK